MRGQMTKRLDDGDRELDVEAAVLVVVDAAASSAGAAVCCC